MSNEPHRTHELLKEQLSFYKHNIINRFKDKEWNSISFNLVVFLLLTSLGFLVRLLLAYQYRIDYYSVFEDPIIWNRIIEFNPNNINFAGYHDFKFYYVTWIERWFDGDWYPYTDWSLAINGQAEYKYSYPPIFLYFLVLMWRPGMNELWMAFPMILADACCSGMVFLIVQEILGEKNKTAYAFFAGLTMCLSPINIIYDGVIWLNPGPVTLFTLISFYFLTKEKWRQTFFWLALATMTKQNALFLTYPIFLVMLGKQIKNNGIKKGTLNSIMNAIYFIIVCIICSMPWVFITPKFYGAHLLFPGQMLRLDSWLEEPTINNTIKFSWSIKKLEIEGLFLKIISFGINSMLLMVMSTTIIAIILYWRSFNNKLDKIELFELISIYIILSHIFMPRGVYKFYSAYYIPFIIIALYCSLNSMGKKNYIKTINLIISTGLFFSFSIWHLVIDRNYTPVILFLACLILGLIACSRIVFKLTTRQFPGLKNQ